ncbi:MAG: L-proline dehydrogenase [Nocardioides sp.]|nr:L-proline dehydrogenase [Nocardioides sp.]
MLSSMLNRASRSTRARRAVEGFPVTRRVVDRFVAGEHIPQVVAAAQHLRDGARSVTIDVLGEDVSDLAGARAMRDDYLTLLFALHEAGSADGSDVSVKLSALGQALPGSGADIATVHARQICTAAAAVGCTVTLDMEDHTTVDATLATGAALRQEFPEIGNVLQSNLRRTPGDIAALSTSGARIRLVKGAYREPASVAHQRKPEVDRAYLADIDALMRSGCYPMIATHDPRMIAHAAVAARECERMPEAWELQMLYGIRTDLQERAVAAGRQMRVYVPFGTDWYGYFMRRLAERPANVAFFLRAMSRH